MDKILIVGGQRLEGRLSIEGAKNAALPLMTACLLTDSEVLLRNTPLLGDLKTMVRLLAQFGVTCEWPFQGDPHTMRLYAHDLTSCTAPYEIVSKMRASILVLGPLLARVGEASVSLPGGCAIGARPVDFHIKGLQAMGAEIVLEEGYIHARAPHGLKGTVFSFPRVSVTGTENLLMAATLAQGTTKLVNVAREPEVLDLVACLNKMGARIEGAGTDTLIIEGVDRLEGVDHFILPDRIEAGTYAVAAAITGGDLLLEKVGASCLDAFLTSLRAMGVLVEETVEGLRVAAPGGPQALSGMDVVTEPYPGFPTDLQAQLMALCTLTQGSSFITESIWENRFMHVPELMRMGADLSIHGHSVLVRGVPYLRGAPVMATDLRASVSLVLAALAAKGETTVSRVYHLDRGYHALEEKLSRCGAHIQRIQERYP